LPEAAARTPSAQPTTGRATGKAAGTSRAEAIGDVILPAIVDNAGMLKLNQQMRQELRTGMVGLDHAEFEHRWRHLFDRNENQFKGRGLKPTPERATAFAKFAAEAAAGRDPGASDFRKQLRKELPTRPDQRTINRWLQEWKKERGQN
jgi:hypothetical protein